MTAEQTDQPYPKRRTVRVHLGPEGLVSLLGLSGDQRVVAIDATNDPLGFNLIVASDQFAEVEHNQVSPRAYLEQECVRLDDGRDFVRATRIVAWS